MSGRNYRIVLLSRHALRRRADAAARAAQVGPDQDVQVRPEPAASRRWNRRWRVVRLDYID